MKSLFITLFWITGIIFLAVKFPVMAILISILSAIFSGCIVWWILTAEEIQEFENDES